MIDRLFQHAFATGKAVRHKTGINEHPVSVAYITMVLARQIFGDLASKHVLLVGLSLSQRGPYTLETASRT